MLDAKIYARSRLQDGMRLFHAGDRLRAVPILQLVLDTPEADPSHSMAAAGLIAEGYRGASDYLRATQYYELALAEGDRIPSWEQRRNEWYVHYKPRSMLGLAMVLRRSLSPDRKSIRALLESLTNEGPGAFSSDVSAQVQLVAGLYDRQLGDIESSCNRLREATDALMEQPLPYTFLGPDHARSLLAQAQLLAPEMRFSARNSSDRVLKDPASSAWSRGLSAAVHLHGAAHTALQRDPRLTGIRSGKHADTVKPALGVLCECAAEDGDLFLSTESCVLRALWFAIAGSRSEALASLDQLLALFESFPHAPTALVFLRGIETLSVCNQLLGGIEASGSARAIYARCVEVSESVSSAARAYGHPLEPFPFGRSAGEGMPFGWLDEPLRSLRALAWP